MPLVTTAIITTTPWFVQNNTPLAGAKLMYRLSADDIDTATNAVIVAKDFDCVIFDNLGSLPPLFGLWPNSRGSAGTSWIIGLKWDDERWVIEPRTVKVPVSSTPLELTTLLASGNPFPVPRKTT